MAGTAILKLDIIGDATKALKAMGLVEDKAKGGMGLTKTAKTIAGAIGTGAMIKFGKDAADAAAADAEAQGKLALTMRNVAGATDATIAANEEWLSGLSKSTAIADDDLRPAMDQLVRGFGNTADAQKALALATDVSAGTGKDLATVTAAMMKAAQGNTTALGKMGVKTKDASGEALSLNEVMRNMSDTFGGQAAASADTAAGKMRGAQIAMGELQETIGGALLPAIETLAPIVSKLAEFFQENTSWLIPLIAAIAGLVAGIKIWTIVQGVLNAVLAANPIVLVVLAVAALVAGIIIAYNKVGWFRDLCQAAFRAVATAFGWITDAASEVFRWIASNWPTLLAILTGPFGLAVLAISRNWDTIKDGASAVFDWIRGVFNGIYDFLSGFVHRVAGVASSIADALKKPINAFIRAWNAIELKIPSVDIPLVGKIGGSTIGLPNIPQLASGGTVLRSGLALVHAGEQFSGVGRSFGSTTINVNVTHSGLGADSPQIQRAVVNALRGHIARNGPLDIPVRSA